MRSPDDTVPILERNAGLSPLRNGVRLRPGDLSHGGPAAECLQERVEWFHEAKLTDYLSVGNSISRATISVTTAILLPMETPDPKRVAQRLRAVMAHLNMTTVAEFGAALGVERSAASNWLNGYNFPPVPIATRILAMVPGATLDWLYRNDASAVPMGLAIRLGALAEAGVVPDVPPDPGGGQPCPNGKAGKGRGSEAGRPRRARQAT